MDKDDIRIGDEVEVVYRGVVRRKNGHFATLSTGPSFRYEAITRIISRAETDAEKIENLERDKAFWKASAESYMNTIIDLQNKLNQAEQNFLGFPVKEEATLEPHSVKIIQGSDKPKWNLFARPWCPPQQEGFGPWIEGKVPDNVRIGGTFQVLYAEERSRKKYTCLIYSPAKYRVSNPENVVAYCTKLGKADD